MSYYSPWNLLRGKKSLSERSSLLFLKAGFLYSHFELVRSTYINETHSKPIIVPDVCYPLFLLAPKLHKKLSETILIAAVARLRNKECAY